MTTDEATATIVLDAMTIAGESFDRLADAWNRADGAGFGEHFADDVDFVDIRGAHHRGASAIGAGHQAILGTIYAASTVVYRVEVARMLAPGLLVAVVAATLDVPSGPMAGVNRSRITAVLSREPDRWAITAFQNTLVQEWT